MARGIQSDDMGVIVAQRRDNFHYTARGKYEEALISTWIIVARCSRATAMMHSSQKLVFLFIFGRFFKQAYFRYGEANLFYPSNKNTIISERGARVWLKIRSHLSSGSLQWNSPLVGNHITSLTRNGKTFGVACTRIAGGIFISKVWFIALSPFGWVRKLSRILLVRQSVNFIKRVNIENNELLVDYYFNNHTVW